MNQQDMNHPIEQTELTDKELAQVEGGGLFSWIKNRVSDIFDFFSDTFFNGAF